MFEPALLHIIEETVCVWLAIGVFFLVDTFYRRHNERLNELYWLRAWSIFAVLGTIAHILTSINMKEYASTVVPLTYLPIQVLDSLFAYFCVFPPNVQNGKRKRVLFAGAGFAFLAGLIVVIFADSVQALSPRGRPQELIQIIPACWVLSRMTAIDWKSRRGMGKFMVFSTAATLLGGVVMMFSGSKVLFDTQFFLAHHFKVISYSIVLMGTAWLLKAIRGHRG